MIIYFESSYRPLSPHDVYLCILSLIIPAWALGARLNVTPAIRHLQLPSAVIRSVILTQRKFLSASALARSHILASLEQTHPSESLREIVTLDANSESGCDTACCLVT